MFGFIKTRYRRSGSLWESRYKASLVGSESYLLSYMRYIEMNPVRAGMVKHPGDYLWSSYHSNAGEKHNMLLTLHPVYKRLGGFIDQQRHAYRELFGSCLDRSELHVIREALNQELVLGREDFKDKIELMTKWQSRPGIPGRPRVEEGSTIYYAI